MNVSAMMQMPSGSVTKLRTRVNPMRVNRSGRDDRLDYKTYGIAGWQRRETIDPGEPVNCT